ncbi:hypothetical protein OH492_07875 [Vibrio chagasii]|nr:hypothetical protein [Vibrio chagasii]
MNGLEALKMRLRMAVSNTKSSSFLMKQCVKSLIPLNRMLDFAEQLNMQ